MITLLNIAYSISLLALGIALGLAWELRRSMKELKRLIQIIEEILK